MFEALEWTHSQEFVDYLFVSGGSRFALFILFTILFAETGLLIGFFLPGDSLLLFVGAVLGSQLTSSGEPLANIWLVNLVLILGAVTGDQVGYFLGRKTGATVFMRGDSRFFKKEYVVKAQEFYAKHGGRAVVFARFVPIMRTFVPFMGGVAKMPYPTFMFYSITGGIFWITSLLWAGYFLGQLPIVSYLHNIIPIIIAGAFLWFLFGFLRRYYFPKPQVVFEKSGGEAVAAQPPGAAGQK